MQSSTSVGAAAEAGATIYCGSVKYGKSFEMKLVEKDRRHINK